MFKVWWGIEGCRCKFTNECDFEKKLKIAEHLVKLRARMQWHPFLTHTTTTILRPFFQDDPGELVPEENFWTLWRKGRLTEADILIIQLGATPSGLTIAHLHHPPHIFLRAGCPSCRPTNSVKALKAPGSQSK